MLGIKKTSAGNPDGIPSKSKLPTISVMNEPMM
jgi:hypothetical protein